MAGGPLPKTVEQRQREGNREKRPLPEPVLVAGRVEPGELERLKEPPERLPKEGKEFWRESIVRLVEVGIIDRADLPALEMLATLYARIVRAGKAISEEGFFTFTSNGTPKEHPAVKIERDSIGMFFRLADHYALTPVARTRLGLAEVHRRTLAKEMETGLGKPNFRKAGQVHVHVKV